MGRIGPTHRTTIAAPAQPAASETPPAPAAPARVVTGTPRLPDAQRPVARSGAASIDVPRNVPGQHVNAARPDMGTRATEAIRHAARGNGEATEAGADIGSRIGSTFGSTGSAVGAAGGALAGAAVTIASRAAEFVVVDVVEGAFRSLGSVFD